MSEFKGTKNKWVLEENDYYFEVICYDEKKSMRFSHHLYKLLDDKDPVSLSLSKEAKANALLISKAPEMLEMLKSCLLAFQQLGIKEPENIKQLIKEATEIC